MSEILVLAERAGGGVRDTTLDAIAVARSLATGAGVPLTVAVIDDEADALAPAVALDGIDEVVLVSAPGSTVEPEIAGMALATLVREREPRAILLGQSVNATALAATLAVRQGLGLATRIQSAVWQDDRLRARREILGGKVEVELEFDGVTAAVLLVSSSEQGAGLAPGSPAVTRVDSAAPGTGRSHHVAFEPPAGGQADLARARVIVAVGRGIGDRDNLEIFEALAQKAGGTLCSSRPLVDAGWLPHSRQVGQSGATVKPAVYLAFGISGAAEHMAGMKDSGTIIAVNTDPRARIFDIAHFGISADACDLAEALLDQL